MSHSLWHVSILSHTCQFSLTRVTFFLTCVTFSLARVTFSHTSHILSQMCHTLSHTCHISAHVSHSIRHVLILSQRSHSPSHVSHFLTRVTFFLECVTFSLTRVTFAAYFVHITYSSTTSSSFILLIHTNFPRRSIVEEVQLSFFSQSNSPSFTPVQHPLGLRHHRVIAVRVSTQHPGRRNRTFNYS